MLYKGLAYGVSLGNWGTPETHPLGFHAYCLDREVEQAALTWRQQCEQSYGQPCELQCSSLAYVSSDGRKIRWDQTNGLMRNESTKSQYANFLCKIVCLMQLKWGKILCFTLYVFVFTCIFILNILDRCQTHCNSKGAKYTFGVLYISSWLSSLSSEFNAQLHSCPVHPFLYPTPPCPNVWSDY